MQGDICTDVQRPLCAHYSCQGMLTQDVCRTRGRDETYYWVAFPLRTLRCFSRCTRLYVVFMLLRAEFGADIMYSAAAFPSHPRQRVWQFHRSARQVVFGDHVLEVEENNCVRRTCLCCFLMEGADGATSTRLRHLVPQRICAMAVCEATIISRAGGANTPWNSFSPTLAARVCAVRY